MKKFAISRGHKAANGLREAPSPIGRSLNRFEAFADKIITKRIKTQDTFEPIANRTRSKCRKKLEDTMQPDSIKTRRPSKSLPGRSSILLIFLSGICRKT